MKKKQSIILLLIPLIVGCRSTKKKEESTPTPSNEPTQQETSPAISTSEPVEPTTSPTEEESSPAVTVTEEETHVSGVELNYETMELYVGKSVTLVATVYPSEAVDKSIEWSSSNEEVLSIDQNGTITGLKEGKSTVSVTTTDGGYTASCVVTVIEEVEETPYVPTGENVTSITEAGTYSYTGTLNNQIYVNAPDAEVIIELNGLTLNYDENSPIYVESAGSIDISAKKGTTNIINDNRAIISEDDATQGGGAIYVKDGDLTLKGAGTLTVNAGYNSGVVGKDDVKVQKLNLNITAPNNGIKGNDSVTIKSGNINISCGGDGLKTENTDISDKGKQRGTVSVLGGTLNIDSWGDAIDASYDALIDQEDEEIETSLTLNTNKYSSYDGETVETSDSVFYLKMNSSTYSNGSYTYAAYINNAWYKATYKGTISSQDGGQGGPGGWGGGGNTSYVYQIEKPKDATSFKLYRFSGSNVTSFSTTSYNAVSDQKAFNDAYDMVQISVRNGSISFSNWSNYSSGNGADVSAKGIKAGNSININQGILSIKAYDDGIHVNKDGSLENGSTPLGNVNIAGGNMEITSADDGIHADNALNISGGTVNVTTAYEGFEGNVIKVDGGNSYVYATDDGINACKGNSTPSIIMNNGLLDVEVPASGDTDGIDSNGSFNLNGGVVFVKGPGSASSSNFGAAALDTDGAVTLKGGTLAVFGGIEQTPSTSGMTKTLCSSNTVSTGSHTISFSGGTSYSTTLKSSTKGCVVYSNLGSATLK